MTAKLIAIEFRFLARTWLFLSLVCLFTSLKAQQPAFPVSSDTALQVVVPDQYILFLKDSLASLDLNKARAELAAGSFRPWNNDRMRMAIGKSNHWFHYRLQNTTGRDIDLGLDCFSNTGHYYVTRGNGRVDTLITGNRVSWKVKTSFRKDNIAVMQLKTGETVDILYKAEFSRNQFQSSFKIALASPGKAARISLEEFEQDYIPASLGWNNFFAGFFAMAALVYLVFYWGVRERLFLYFALFVFFIGLTSFLPLYYINNDYPGFQMVNFLMNPVGTLLFVLFYREYFQTRKHLPRWDRILIGFQLFVFIAALLDIVLNKNRMISLILNVGSIGTAIALTITPFRIRNMMKTEKRFLLYASLPFLLLIPITSFLLVVILFMDRQKLFNNQLFIWVVNHLEIVTLLTFFWMVLSFSRILIRRFNEQRNRIRQQELEKEQMALERERERTTLMEKQKLELEQQVAERTAELRRSLDELKNAQAQLVQSEKMASLGEMTAGIAHEIQNPLNFVNNFAEVNREISEELKEELLGLVEDPVKKKNIESLLEDLAGNEEKIRYHGKRADNIVKNMLQHSRKGTEQKEAVALNELVDEYMKLSFHGLRARDKSFNADFAFEADPSIGTVPLLAQDFGRVILNLFNNAFYAVNEKKKSAPDDYQPRVQAATRTTPAGIEVRISDNGMGIPEKIKDKIFQPFFTTKPTGEGTGLGLSISYDIITKGHGGTLTTTSEEGQGTTFTITIPD